MMSTFCVNFVEHNWDLSRVVTNNNRNRIADVKQDRKFT